MVDLYKWKHFNPKCPSVLTLHNLNAWHQKTFKLRSNVFHSIDSKVASIYGQSILDEFEYINIVNPTLEYSAFTYFENKKILTIPFSYALPSRGPSHFKAPEFIVPGTVDERRRDYMTLLDCFSILYQDYPEVRLTFLGKCDFEHNEKYLTTFKKRVATDLYNKMLKFAAFIICPSVLETHTVNTATEFYGKTKSPNIFDAIKYRKPLIVPDHLKIPKEFEECSIKYKDASDLFCLCEEYLKIPERLVALHHISHEAMKPFELENIRKKLMIRLQK